MLFELLDVLTRLRWLSGRCRQRPWKHGSSSQSWTQIVYCQEWLDKRTTQDHSQWTHLLLPLIESSNSTRQKPTWIASSSTESVWRTSFKTQDTSSHLCRSAEPSSPYQAYTAKHKTSSKRFWMFWFLRKVDVCWLLKCWNFYRWGVQLN
jgi:hypothetical protein